jgi:O-antigen/teichoic acid export membrane protein
MIKKVSVTILFYGYSQFIAFLIFILTARFFGLEGRGIYAAVISIGTFASTLLGLSIGNVLPYFVVHSKGGRDVFFKNTFFTLISLLSIFVCATSILLILVYFIKPSLFGNVPLKYLLAGALSIPYFIWIGCNDHVFSTSGEIIQQNKIAFINRTCFIIISFLLLLFLEISLFNYLVIYGVFNLLQLAHEFIFLVRKFKPVFTFDASLAKNIVKKGLQAHLVTIAALLTTTFSVLVVNYYCKDIKEVGDYNFAVQVSSLLMVIPMVVNRYFISDVSSAGITKELWQKQVKVMKYCLLVMAGVAIAAYFLIVPFCYLIKKEFYSAIPLFRWLLIIIVPSSFCFLMQSQWYSRGYFKAMSGINISVGIIAAVISILFVPHFKSYGAVAAMIFTYCSLSIVNVLFYFRIQRKIREAGELLPAAALKAVID